MIDVNWDLAPEGADRVVVRFYNGDEMSCKKVIQRPTQKTVADAVEYYEGVWPDEKDSVCVWDDKRKKFEFWISDYEPVSYCYEVCNYEQFEAYAVEQEGEKWTQGDKCYCVDFDGVCELVLIEGSQVIVRKESGNLGVSYVENLDPIKPTLTKADFADFVIEKLNDGTHQSAVCYLLQEKLDTHDII